jgi:hypothetical protein
MFNLNLVKNTTLTGTDYNLYSVSKHQENFSVPFKCCVQLLKQDKNDNHVFYKRMEIDITAYFILLSTYSSWVIQQNHEQSQWNHGTIQSWYILLDVLLETLSKTTKA